MDTKRAERLAVKYTAWRSKRAEAAEAREAVIREMDRALDAGDSQAEIARLFGVSRQAVNDLLREGSK